MTLPLTAALVMLTVLCAGCRPAIVVTVPVDEVVDLADGRDRDGRTRRSVVSDDGRTVEIGGRFDVVLRPLRGPTRVYRHPVIIQRDGEDLVVRGSNRPGARIRVDQVALVTVYAGQAPSSEPREADHLAAEIDCPRRECDIDALPSGLFAVAGCGDERVVTCRDRGMDSRLQFQTEPDCTAERASWASAVRPWRRQDESPSATGTAAAVR